MIFIILFASSFILLALFIFLKFSRLQKKESLQTRDEWFRIDLANTQKVAHTHVTLHMRRYIRNLLRTLLTWYRAMVRYIRASVRRKIQKTLHHYDEKNDPVPLKSSSVFLDDMHNHKETVRKARKKKEIHNDFPEEYQK